MDFNIFIYHNALQALFFLKCKLPIFGQWNPLSCLLSPFTGPSSSSFLLWKIFWVHLVHVTSHIWNQPFLHGDLVPFNEKWSLETPARVLEMSITTELLIAFTLFGGQNWEIFLRVKWFHIDISKFKIIEIVFNFFDFMFVSFCACVLKIFVLTNINVFTYLFLSYYMYITVYKRH